MPSAGALPAFGGVEHAVDPHDDIGEMRLRCPVSHAARRGLRLGFLEACEQLIKIFVSIGLGLSFERAAGSIVPGNRKFPGGTFAHGGDVTKIKIYTKLVQIHFFGFLTIAQRFFYLVFYLFTRCGGCIVINHLLIVKTEIKHIVIVVLTLALFGCAKETQPESEVIERVTAESPVLTSTAVESEPAKKEAPSVEPPKKEEPEKPEVLPEPKAIPEEPMVESVDGLTIRSRDFH